MKKYGLIILLILFFVYNLFITNKGAVSFGDENIYYESVLAIESLTHGDIKGFSSHINNSRGRPGEALLRTVPATIQGLLYKFKGISPANPESLRIPIFFNILVNITVLFLFYKLANTLFNNYKYALLSVILYKLLINSNIYLRHIFPYEKSLVCFLLILYIYFKKKETSWQVYFILGILCAFSFAIYPGYYFIPVLLALLVFSYDVLEKNDFILFFKHGTQIFSGFLLVILAFELFARIGNSSYIQAGNALSETIDQGSFDESLIFPIKYLFQVEGISGICIMISSLFILLIIIQNLFCFSVKKILHKPIILIFLFSLFGIIIHGILGTFFHKMVFYGRLMHLYVPILILSLVYLITLIKQNNIKTSFSILIASIFLINFIYFNISYNKIDYPKDMLYSLKIDNKRFIDEQMICETTPLFKVLSPNPLSKLTNAPYTNDSRFIIVNSCYFFPVKDKADYKKFIPDANLKCIADKQHYQTFPAYMMEGYSLEERINISKRKYRIQFYRKLN